MVDTFSHLFQPTDCSRTGMELSIEKSNVSFSNIVLPVKTAILRGFQIF